MNSSIILAIAKGYGEIPRLQALDSRVNFMKGHWFAHQVNSNTFISWSIHLSYQPFICPVIFNFGLSLPMRALKSVLLPAPEAPIIASVRLGLAFPCTFCKIFFTWPPPLSLEGTNTQRLDQEIVGWWFSVDSLSSNPSSRINMSESNVTELSLCITYANVV